MFFAYSVSAHSAFFQDHARGWHWYEVQPKPVEKQADKKTIKEKEKVKQDTLPSLPLSPTLLLKQFKQRLQESLDRALVYPTVPNIRAYMVLQQHMMERAERFGKGWLQALYLNPALDYTVSHPVSQVGIHTATAQERQEMRRKIKALSQSYGLFFFFKKDCPYCHAFAPIVKAFSRTYNWTILAISLDGSTLPEFPDAVKDNGASTRLGIDIYPTLLAVHPQTQSVIPLSYGLSTQDQIEQRLKILLSGIKS